MALASSSQKLEELYIQFNDVYYSISDEISENDQSDIRELIKKARVLAGDPEVDIPQACALLSYMLLETSRIPAMVGTCEMKKEIKSQDRKLWDRALIKEGLFFLERSAEGNTVSLYHLKAAVSACHSLAKDFRSTDWEHMLSLYDSYLKLNSSPEMALERTQVLARFKGPRAEIKGLEEILAKYQIENGHLLYDRIGDLRCRLYEYREALECFEKALGDTNTKTDKSKYRKKIKHCKARLSFKDKYAVELSF